MNRWLANQALSYHQNNLSRVWILTPTQGDTGVVAGYFTLSSSQLVKTQFSKKQRVRGGGVPQPERVPATLIGKFAVDREYQGTGLADWMMYQAYLRFIESATAAASQFLTVELRNEDKTLTYLRDFYRKRFGFQELTGDDAPQGLVVMAKRADEIAEEVSQIKR